MIKEGGRERKVDMRDAAAAVPDAVQVTDTRARD